MPRLPLSALLALPLLSVPLDAQCTSDVQSATLPSGLVDGPRLWTPDGAPVVDSAFSLAVDRAPGAAFAGLFLSAAQGPGVSVAGGTFWIDGATSIPYLPFVTLADGTAALGGLDPVPASFCGIDVVAQVGVSTSPGFDLTNAVSLRFGASTGLDFDAVTTIDVGESPRGLTVVDVDADGELDLVSADTASSTVSIVFGAPSLLGGFTPSVQFAVGSCPGSVGVADLDGDGALDVVTENSGSDDLSILFGDGFGGFLPAVTGPSTSGPRGLVVEDFDSDGVPDVAVCNFSDDTVSTFFGLGDGTFVAGQVIPVVDGPFHMVSADMDADGSPDLVIAARNSDDVQVALGSLSGTFAAPVAQAVGDRPRRVTVADFDEDGVLDVAAANWFDDSVSVLLGNGDGTLQAALDFVTPARPTQLDAADLDGDGHQDLAVLTNELDVSVFLGHGDGTFGPLTSIAMVDAPNGVALRDVDHDGNPDIVATRGDSSAGGCPAPMGSAGFLDVRTNLLGQ